MIPASSGCTNDVIFGSKNSSWMFGGTYFMSWPKKLSIYRHMKQPCFQNQLSCSFMYLKCHHVWLEFMLK